MVLDQSQTSFSRNLGRTSTIPAICTTGGSGSSSSLGFTTPAPPPFLVESTPTIASSSYSRPPDLFVCNIATVRDAAAREVVRSPELHQARVTKTLSRSLAQLWRDLKKGWKKLRNRVRRVPGSGESPNVQTHRSLTILRSSPTLSNISSNETVSLYSTPHNSPAESTYSSCTPDSCGEPLTVTIRVLRVARQTADIAHIPQLRGVIETALHIAQLIEEMGGTHHSISQVIESSGWLLEEITLYVAKSKLSKDMEKTLTSFQEELTNLQMVVTRISNRGHASRFLLHDADIRAITMCTTSIKAIYDELEVKLALDNRQAIARLEGQLALLRSNATPRQCECGGGDSSTSS